MTLPVTTREDFFMKKRLVVLLLTMAMAITSITGCGSSTAATDTAPTADTAPTVETSATADASDYYVEEEPLYEMESSAATAESTNNTIKGDTAKTEATTSNEAYEDYDSLDEAYYAYDPADGEKYKEREENGFTSVITNPLSTFAADVDTAGYTNVRRLIESGYGIGYMPEGSVKVEEMVNYFNYDYGRVKKGEVFGVDATISDCPWNEDSKLMVLGVTKMLWKRMKCQNQI